MTPFRRAFLACAVAGLVTATGCTTPETVRPAAPTRSSEPVPRAQLPAPAAPKIPEPEWGLPAQPSASASVPQPTPLATVEWTSTTGATAAPSVEPVRRTHSGPEWIGTPVPPVVTVERGN